MRRNAKAPLKLLGFGADSEAEATGKVSSPRLIVWVLKSEFEVIWRHAASAICISFAEKFPLFESAEIKFAGAPARSQKPPDTSAVPCKARATKLVGESSP